MISDAVLVAIITGAFAVLGQWMITRNDRKKRNAAEMEKEKNRAIEEAVREERLENRLSSIENKLDVHNGYAEKLGAIQTDIAVIKNDVKTLYKKEEHS